MNETIHFYVIRNGEIVARTLKFSDALDLAHQQQFTEKAAHSDAHYVIIKGCEQFVPYVEVTA